MKSDDLEFAIRCCNEIRSAQETIEKNLKYLKNESMMDSLTEFNEDMESLRWKYMAQYGELAFTKKK